MSFDREVFQHPKFSERCNLTGDLLGHAGLDQLHRLDAFQWLNSELACHVSTYLLDLLGQDHGLSVHVQKAWPVVCASGGVCEWWWQDRISLPSQSPAQRCVLSADLSR